MSTDNILALDLDDTIVDSEKAYVYALKSVGIDPQDENFLLARKMTKDTLPHGSPSARSRFLYFKVFLELTGSYSAKLHLDLFEAYLDALGKNLKTQCEELNRQKLFKELRLHFKQIIVITNETTHTQIKKISSIDPDGHFFDSIITSEEIGVEKPNLQIFEYAFKKLKCTPNQILFIGDSFINDIQPAIRLGMKSIKTIEFKDDKQFSSAHSIIKKLDDYHLFL